jgi:hypothetical protein
MTTYTTAQVNGWFQTIDGLPSTTAPIPSNLSGLYVSELNAGTATVPQIQANLENFPNMVPNDLFYRTSVAGFVLTEFQLAWGVVPDATQYEAWVARIIADPSALWSGGGMSMALIGTTEFANLFGTTNPDQPATIGQINTLCANCGITPGAGALANVGLPLWQVLQNFAESSKVAAALDGSIANFQDLLLAGQTPSGSILTLSGSTGSMFTLTPGADIPPAFSTSTADAVFNAFPVVATSGLLNNTLNAGDNLQDTVGDGTLNYTASGSSFSNPSFAVGVTLNGIKTLNYIGSFSGPDAGGGFQGSVTGLTVVNDTGSTGGLQLGGVGQGLVTPLTNVNITGYGPIGGITLDTPAMFRGIISAAAGTSTTPLAVNITGPVGSSNGFGAAVLAVATDGSPGTAASPNAAYSEWDLTLSASANLQLEQNNSSATGVVPPASVGGVTTLKLIGAGNAFLGQDVAGDWQKLTTIDASGETGTVVITGGSSGVAGNAFGSAVDPTWLLGSAAGLLNDAPGTFALTTFDLSTGTNVLDVSSASATELAALTTTPGSTVATDNVIIVNDLAATTTSTATFAAIAGFSELGVTAADGTINMSNLPTSITDIIYFTPSVGPVTISNAISGLTLDFHGNNQGALAATVTGPTTGTATLNLDFGNGVLLTEDHTGLITTTGYSTIDITPIGNGVLGDPDTATELTLAANASNPLSVSIGGTQSFETLGIIDLAATPTSATDTLTVTDPSTVLIEVTNFATVTAGSSASAVGATFTVNDEWHNSNITGSSTGDNTLSGGDGGGVVGSGNTITGGAGSDTIVTGIGANIIKLGATHITDSVTIGTNGDGVGPHVITEPGDVAVQGGWGQAFGATATPIAGAASALFGVAANGGTSQSVTTISGFSVATGTTDSLNFQYGLWDSTHGANAAGGTDLGLQTIDLAGNVGFVTSTAITTETATSGGALTAGANIIELNKAGVAAVFSNAAGLATALQTSYSLTTGALPTLDNAHLLVAYSNGTNINIADVDLYNPTAAATAASTLDHVYASDMVSLTGVTNYANLNTLLHPFVA